MICPASPCRTFDLDENESLDAQEIQAACAAAGLPISDRNLQKAMKLLDRNADGVIDLAEFKGIAIMGHKRAAAHSNVASIKSLHTLLHRETTPRVPFLSPHSSLHNSPCPTRRRPGCCSEQYR